MKRSASEPDILTLNPFHPLLPHTLQNHLQLCLTRVEQNGAAALLLQRHSGVLPLTFC
jgi:hypothetical protein